MSLIDRLLDSLRLSDERPACGSLARRAATGFGGILLGSLLASSAAASDGRVELDQSCAVTTGCMAGDAPGFPITITGGGGRSFVLTSDLVVPGVTTDGIQVFASDVSIDLNDHTILHSSCVGATTSCTTTATNAAGIRDSFASAGAGGTSVRDGSLVGFTWGAQLGRGHEVRGVLARWNAFNGVSGRGRGSLVLENRAEANLLGGLRASTFDPGSVVIGNRLVGNQSTGLFVEAAGAVVIDNVALDNGGTGIGGSEVSVVLDNVAFGNAQYGLAVLDDSVVWRNTAYDNDDAGFLVGGGSLVRANVARGSSTGEGLIAVLPAGQGHMENVWSSNGGGDVFGTWLDLGANACGGTPGCP